MFRNVERSPFVEFLTLPLIPSRHGSIITADAGVDFAGFAAGFLFRYIGLSVIHFYFHLKKAIGN